jgi:hypothetical protein
MATTHTPLCNELRDHQYACVCGADRGETPSNEALRKYLIECHACGGNAVYSGLCDNCDTLNSNNWPVLFGTSIRSFARRARAEELERTIWEGAHEAADHHVIGRHSSARSGWYRVSAALTELATMAKESA